MFKVDMRRVLKKEKKKIDNDFGKERKNKHQVMSD